MKTLGVVLSGRMIDGELPSSDEISLRYYISSAELTAEELSVATRSHWFMKISCTGGWMLR
ncbi:hypothetical protein CI610_01899 [invertebrate metagenome]|uniref:Uncharacterized protein n=1 Tax=invertebrate metagenome TaxID=1711999 RepID=A0A2H9T7E6_9ZZZZ